MLPAEYRTIPQPLGFDEIYGTLVGGLRHRAACGLGARRGVVAVVVVVVLVSVVGEGDGVVLAG